MKNVHEIEVYLAIVDFAMTNYNFMTLEKTSTYDEDLTTINKINDILFKDGRITSSLLYRDIDEVRSFAETISNRITAISIEADKIEDYHERIKYIHNNTIYIVNEIYMKIDEEHTSATEAINVLKTLQSTVIWNTRNMINEDTTYTTEIEYSRDLIVETTDEHMSLLMNAEDDYRTAKSDILTTIDKFKLDSIEKGYKVDREGLIA